MVDTYSMAEHQHRFAVWTAARAAQRGAQGLTTARVQPAFAVLQEELAGRATEAWRPDGYDEAHRPWGVALQGRLTKAGVPADTATCGRCAKLINVYVKAMYVVPNAAAHAGLIATAHPPIDRQLLTAILAARRARQIQVDPAVAAAIAAFNQVGNGWTGWTATDYAGVVKTLRALLQPGSPFWTIERYWTPA